MHLNVGSRARTGFMLLAPSSASLSSFRGQIVSSEHIYSELLTETQRLRGRVYLEDNAITPADLTRDGRYISELDDESWHLLTMSRSGKVVGCTRFRQYPNTVTADELSVSKTPIASSDVWGRRFCRSLTGELTNARAAGFSYVEVGGWALDHEVRGSAAALNSVLATYAWSRLQGGAIGVSTATERNGSASILRRLGGKALEFLGSQVPPYYDHSYGCMMEVLRFDSRAPNPRYSGMIDSLVRELSSRPVICARREVREATRPWHFYPSLGISWGSAMEATA